jgi:hypothetical protein
MHGSNNTVGVSTPGVPELTNKFVVARPSPDGLARDGTQGGGGKRGSCYPAPGGCARSRGYKRSRERVSLFVSPFSRATFCMKALDLPFIDARRGSRCIMGV